MPWAVWVLAILLIAMAIPTIGSSVAGYLLLFTNLVTQTVEKLVAAALAGRMSEPGAPSAVSPVADSGAAAPTEAPPLWRRFGWSGVIWLAAIVVLAVGIVIKRHTGHSGRGLTNLLILMIGWAVCFQLAKRVAPGAAPR